MIAHNSCTKEWIEAVASTNKADKILVEKMIRALILLEGLTESGLFFVLKGGTALMLLLEAEKRLSIDIDIIVSDKEADFSGILQTICMKKGFTGFEKQDRTAATKIDKAHYKFFFISALNNQTSQILLDVINEDIHYQNTIDIPIENRFIDKKCPSLIVKLPDFNNILGDKLTAFAPNTTGIPYRKGNKEMGMEIIKQMYDIGCLCDKADNPEVVSTVFSCFAKTELQYRESKYCIENVLDDIIDTALSICLRQSQGEADVAILLKGIIQVKPFIFSETFHLEKAITYAAKVAYLASVIKYKVKHLSRFVKTLDMTDWVITAPTNTKLNKIKKTDPEAFYYLYQMSEIVRNSKDSKI